MKIDRLDLALLKLPLVSFFETSFGRIYDKHFIVVTLHGDGVTALRRMRRRAGSVLQRRDERNRLAYHQDFIAPRVLGANFEHPRDVFPALKAIRGHNMAKAAVEMASWDPVRAAARRALVSAAIGGTRERIASGVSIGIQDSLDQLCEKIEPRACGRLPADQDQDQAGLGPRGGGGCAGAIRRRSR